MIRWFYNLSLYLVLPLVLLYFLWRGLREPAYLTGWGKRLGASGKLPENSLWVHAASVGEVQAALPLIKALYKRYPQSSILLTTFTPTGRAQARKALGDTALIQFLPFDLPHATWAFMRRARPRMAIIIETELWPNLLRSCARADVPVVIVNARLSEKSITRYQRWPMRALMKPALRAVTQVAAASDADARAFQAMGIPDERITVSGNLKFDLVVPENIAETGQALRHKWLADNRPVWVAASTHAGEEVLVLDALTEVLKALPNLLLILVPRHPQRFSSVATLCSQRGFTVTRRSSKDPVDSETQILLGDTLGELVRFYAAADVALVGGSLVPDIGGHNLLEPAALRLPIAVGTHLGSWSQVADWLQEASALIRVSDAPSLAQAIVECMEDERGRKLAGIAGARVVEAHGGALERTLRLISSNI